MDSKEWRNWIDDAEKNGIMCAGPLRELCTDLESAERRAAALEAECGRLCKTAKTAATRAVAEWGARQVMRIEQPTLAEAIMAAIDAALAPQAEPERSGGQGREEER